LLKWGKGSRQDDSSVHLSAYDIGRYRAVAPAMTTPYFRYVLHVAKAEKHLIEPSLKYLVANRVGYRVFRHMASESFREIVRE